MNRQNNKELLYYTSPELQESDEKTTSDLPSKSKTLYEAAYKTFVEWREANCTTKSTSEEVLLTYFNELAKKYKPTSLWAIHSMLKSTINLNEKVDISTYSQLTDLLKKKSVGFQSKKSSVFTSEQVNKFLTEAPDYHYLVTKVALIFGVSGACRKNDLINVKVKDIKKEGNLLVVRIPCAKTKTPRSFIIGSEFSSIVKKYEYLRPKNVSTDRFFLNYRNGKCISQVIGINKFAKMPYQISQFLNLPNPKSYTGHSFRLSSATLLADPGTNILPTKRLGESQSKTVAEDIIEEYKVKIENCDEDTDIQPTKLQRIEINVHGSNSKDIYFPLDERIFKFENCSVTINYIK